MLSRRLAYVGKAMYGGLKKEVCTLPAPRSPARVVRSVFQDNMLLRYIPSRLGGWGMNLQECVEARKVRTDQRWDAGVRASGG
jgi:hypothetical protein